MSDELTIDFRWMNCPQSDAFNQAFAAEIGIKLGSQWMTEFEEFESRTTLTHVRACAHTLALWMAANWWRLRWEPEPREAQSNVDWRIAHSLASAGDGFAWPNIVFASDGESLAVASIPRLSPAAHEPLRYLNAVHGRISAIEFELKIDSFIGAIISRQDAIKVADSDLPLLWKEVLEERSDPDMSRWRRLEALCGYDPDEAPESVIKMLTEDRHHLGKHALEEVAAYGRHDTADVLKPIVELAKNKGAPKSGGFRCHQPTLKNKPNYGADMRPWSKATRLAQVARKEWGLDKGIVSNMHLGDILRMKRSAFSDHSAKSATPMALALRDNNDGDAASMYFTSSWGTTRRFKASCLIGHWLNNAVNTERLLTATDVKTADQQFQRAFAQEFLCPFEELRERLPYDRPSNDDIEDAAADFGVSPLVVRTALVNKGELDREALAWAA